MNLKYTIAVWASVCATVLAGCGDLDNYEAPESTAFEDIDS